MKSYRIKIKRPNIAYPGSTVQQNYSEDLTHGYLLWDIVDKQNWDVGFHELSNPKPFVTIAWANSVKATVDVAKQYVKGTRFRIYNKDSLSQKDVSELTSALKQELVATEVTFKTDHHVNRNVINTGKTTVVKDDLRSAEVLVKLMRDYNTQVVSNDEWDSVHELIKEFLASATGNDEIIRNVTWSLRHLTFDNLFGYGEGNVVNFDALNGIVGVFGPNRVGKSSVVGSIMYSLFNTTDRGSVKNLHVINARKLYCCAKAIINVSGTDYVIERQTVKRENFRGEVHASTALNVFKIDESGEAIDLVGEQRTDTERVIKKLIGNSEDYLMTSLAAQDELKVFITNGSSKRKQVLSRFLDLDIFDNMYDLAKSNVNSAKAVLKSLPDRDWTALDEKLKSELVVCDRTIEEKNGLLFDAHEKLNVIRDKLVQHKDFTPVTRVQVEQQRNRVNQLLKQATDLTRLINDERIELDKNKKKLQTIAELQQDYNVIDLRKRLEAFRALEASVMELKHSHEKEALTLKQQERSLKILDDVPCGDEYPTCRFIKDAHVNKTKIVDQRERAVKVFEKLQRASDALTELKDEDLANKVSKVEKLNDMQSQLQVLLSEKGAKLLKEEASLEGTNQLLEPAKVRLLELDEALKNEENAEVVLLRTEIDEVQTAIKQLDVDKLSLASERGRIQTIIDKHDSERLQRVELLQKMKIYELVFNAFSRKGIPRVIVSSQLPIINAEVAKILNGIVDFTVELETDDESDSMEVYINYGDSRRIIELGSGMEKMIASIAIRVALINISSLPKTDMFIIDEGFGSLDDMNLEACNRLLASLKRYFKTIVVITHVDAVKDAADVVIEINKNEKDAKVCYE